MLAKETMFQVLLRFSEVQTGKNPSCPWNDSETAHRRYEREAWDLYGIFFSGHPDL